MIMMHKGFFLVAAVVGMLAAPPLADALKAAEIGAGDLAKIETTVVIYAENRGFDNLFGNFPGANGLLDLSADAARQTDRDGTPLAELPPIWKGLTGRGVVPAITESQTAHLPNAPFAIDDASGFNTPISVTTRDLVHRFYEDQMQINGGKNDRYVAYGDSGALVMGHYDGSKMALWSIAQRYALADNFFMGGFGGSFFNHFMLICACAPYYPDADKSPAKGLISAVEDDGVSLKLAANSPKSALDGPPKFESSGSLSPDFYAINTMQPPYQPSANPAARGGDPAFADPSMPTTLPPQTQQTIGELLSSKNVTWAYYGAAWQAALDGKNAIPVPNFQYHHQPFNYFVAYAPGTPARAEHLRDGGLAGIEFIKAVDAGTLPQVAFYKPQGNLNEHPGYTDVAAGDAHLADLVAHLEKSPQWPHMLVVITFDENGGFWDHAAPPKGDRWGPGTRIPALIVSPFVKPGSVDHTLYDTTSILRFVTRRFDLPVLAGLKARDEAMAKSGSGRLGDLTQGLDFSGK
jgi:phospholipase C